MENLKPKIAILVNNGVEYDARVLKTAEALNDFGYKVAVFCVGIDEAPSVLQVGGIEYWRFHKRFPDVIPSPGNSNRCFVFYRRVVNSCKIRAKNFLSRVFSSVDINTRVENKSAKELNKIEKIVSTVENRYYGGLKDFSPDLVYANDLDCLVVAHNYSAQYEIPFVIDMHELQSERPFRNEPKLRDTVIKIENSFLKKASAVITVSEKISDWYAKNYLIDFPEVVYNSPEFDYELSVTSKKDLRTFLGLSDSAKICVYTGILTVGRGIETVVSVLSEYPELHYALVGPRNNIKALETLKKLAKQHSVESRVHFVDPVPYKEVSAFISTADFGIIPAVAKTLNQEYGLPNKLFEMIFAGLPIVCVDIKQRRTLLDKYGVGFYMEDNSSKEIKKCFRLVLEHVAVSKNKDDARLLAKKSISEAGWFAQREKIRDICIKALTNKNYDAIS